MPPTVALPELALRRSFPVVRGANTHAPPPPKGKQGLSAQTLQLLQNTKKVMHIEVGWKHVDLIRQLVEIGKTAKIFKAYWGPLCHPLEMLDTDAPHEAKNNLLKMSQNHQNFIFGSRTERRIGATNINWKVAITNPDRSKGAKFSLHDILINHLTTSDGKKVLDSVHQRCTDELFSVVQNSGEVESFMFRLNHQLPAFLLHYL